MFLNGFSVLVSLFCGRTVLVLSNYYSETLISPRIKEISLWAANPRAYYVNQFYWNWNQDSTMSGILEWWRSYIGFWFCAT